MKKISLLLVSLCLIFTSCEKDSVDSLKGNESKEDLNLSVLKFTYKDISYSSFFTQDSLITLKDQTANEIYQNLQNIPTLATYIHEDGSIHFFDTFADLQAHFKPIEKFNTLRAADASAFLTLFADSNWRGNTYSITGSVKVDWVGKDFNDKATTFSMGTSSSFGYSTYNVTFFKDAGFKGASLSFSVQKGYTRGESFSNFHTGFLGLGGSWNDEVSSFETWFY